MQMGFNNDVDYLGMTLHIQTEDHGMAARKITSQLFFSGAILESRTLSYAASVEAIEVLEEQQELIRKQMRTMHKAFYKRIQEGAYDSKLVVHATREAEVTAQFAAVSGAQADEAAAAEFEPLEALRTAHPVAVGGVGVERQEPVRLGTIRAYRGITDPEDEISLTVALLKALGGSSALHRAQP